MHITVRQEKCLIAQFKKLTLLFVFGLQKAFEVNELCGGDVLRIDVYTMSLTSEEVRAIDCSCTAPIHSIKAVPAHSFFLMLTEVR